MGFFEQPNLQHNFLTACFVKCYKCTADILRKYATRLIKSMNIVYPQSNPAVAKTCACKEIGRQKVTYEFSEEFHSLCMDKRDILQDEVEACEKLLKYVANESERAIIEKEITELKMAMDLMT